MYGEKNYVIINEETGDYYNYFYEFPKFTKVLVVAQKYMSEDDADDAILRYKLINCIVATTSLYISEIQEKLEIIKHTKPFYR